VRDKNNHPGEAATAVEPDEALVLGRRSFLNQGPCDRNAGMFSPRGEGCDRQSPVTIFGRCSSDSPLGCERPQPEDSMKNLTKKLQRFLVSEDGPTAVEYAVMLALIIVVCLTAINSIGSKANTTFSNVAGSIAS
jgi:pilus assembly protein Flp/PilA